MMDTITNVFVRYRKKDQPVTTQDMTARFAVNHVTLFHLGARLSGLTASPLWAMSPSATAPVAG